MSKNLIKLKILFVFGVVLFSGFYSQVLCFDLTEEISSMFQKFYNEGYKDSYLSSSYSSSYSKDPFGDSLKNLESMSKQLRVSGVQYVENALGNYGCSLSQDKIWAILYYFVPDFRTELARSMKIALGDMDGKNYVYDEKVIEKYCREYFLCFENKDKDSKKITDSSAEDSMTSCKEFFQKYYSEGRENEQRLQNLQKSQLGVDKFWNSTLDDSPYDIMTDLGTIGELLYEEILSPITPVFYNLPLFSNSKNSLKSGSDKENSGSSGGRRSVGGDGRSSGSERIVLGSDVNSDGEVSLRGDLGEKTGSIPLSFGDRTPLVSDRSEGFDKDLEYDKLVEGLGGYSLVNHGNLQYGSLCEVSDVEDVEPESSYVVENSEDNNTSVGRDLSELSNDEYEEVIDYMLDAVDKYASLPEDKEEEIRRMAGDVSDYNSAVTEGELEEVANKIKNCRKSCEGFRIDQKASCMLMCACGEIKSPIFNPEKTPGLGPIFMIRFCTIPAVDSRFSVGGRKMFSIEEGMNEIYGVNDKLSREGKLGIWTQQYNFLDSTTKDIKIKDMISFTINVEWVDIANKSVTHSKQYSTQKAESNNKVLQFEYSISNPLENNVSKNHYRLVGFEGEDLDDLRASANGNDVKERLSQLAVTLEIVTDQTKDSHASRYGEISEILNNWLDQEGDFWVNTLGYLKDIDSYAQVLYSKR